VGTEMAVHSYLKAVRKTLIGFYEIVHVVEDDRSWRRSAYNVDTQIASFSDLDQNQCPSSHSLQSYRVNGRHSHLNSNYPGACRQQWNLSDEHGPTSRMDPDMDQTDSAEEHRYSAMCSP
jgi:hypothetical protein